jgi:hypothetical protein
MSSEQLEAERKLFEEACGFVKDDYTHAFERSGDGYIDTLTQFAWRTWRAFRSQPSNAEKVLDEACHLTECVSPDPSDWKGTLYQIIDWHIHMNNQPADPTTANADLVASDLSFEAFPSDPGGMRAYKPKGVKITHKPTGITVTCNHERSQHKNRDAALRALKSAISQPAAPRVVSTQADVENVARAIWNIRREAEDRCDVEVEDLRKDHSVWLEARAALESLAATYSVQQISRMSIDEAHDLGYVHPSESLAPSSPLPVTDALKEDELSWRRRSMKSAWDYLGPNASSDMEWSDEIITAIDNRVDEAKSLAPAQQEPIGEVIAMGGVVSSGMVEVLWADGLTPLLGTRLYASPKPAQPSVPVEALVRLTETLEGIGRLSPLLAAGAERSAELIERLIAEHSGNGK